MSSMTPADIEASIKASPALPDKADDRDFLAGAVLAAATSLPESFSLRDRLSSVKTQGIRGTCTAHATAAVAEFFNRAEWNDPQLDLSEEFLFKKTKDIDQADYGYAGYGAYMRSAAKAIQKYGTCREATLPYRSSASESSWQSLHLTSDQEAEALLYRTSSYASVAVTADAIKQALIQTNAPLMGGFMLFSSYRESATNGGFIPVPKVGEKEIGGHAMAIIGYTPTHLILKNSWGTSWGDGGYIYWPITALSHAYSLWSFIDAENTATIEARMKDANKKRVSSWALSAWNAADQKHLISAHTDPKGVLTKEEFMVFLDRLCLLTPQGGTQTPAITKNKKAVSTWARTSWDTAIAAKVVRDDTLPRAVLTKEELLVFLDRLGRIVGSSGVSDATIHSNRAQVSPWALPSWDKGIDAGIVTRDTLPKATLTKEEFMVFLSRIALI